MPSDMLEAATELRELSYAEAVREALGQAMEADERVFLFGEDVGVYGGAFGVSGDLVHRFGTDRVIDTPAVMGGEDFSRFYLADKSVQSLIFWVGGVPAADYDKAGGDPTRLPSLHSPFWAPDAQQVVSTATEALTAAALDILKKG